METLAKRVKFGRKKRGLSQDQLAEASGMGQGDISKIETGRILRTTGVVALARALSCDPHWLESGEGSPLWGGDENTTSAPDTRGKVPLVSWVTAGNMGDVHDQYQPGEADEWIEVYETKPSTNTFALRVTGDSMTNPMPGDISFPDGTIIIVDPNRSVDPGNFVVAKDVTTQKATFKRLAYDGGRWFLKPLNPAYPMVEIDDPAVRVIGKVTEFHIRGKL